MSSSVVAEANHMEKEESLRLAIAVSLLRSKIQNYRSSSSTSLCDAAFENDAIRWKQKNRRSSSSTSRCDAPPSEADALRWKKKAKERKKYIIRLQEHLKEAKSASHYSHRMLLASVISLILGVFSDRRIGEASESRFNDVLRRRFLRISRKRGRRKSSRPSQRLWLSGYVKGLPRLGSQSIISQFQSSSTPLYELKLLTLEPEYEEEAEQLRISIDFLLALSQAGSNASNFSNWSHQAVDFILEVKQLETIVGFYVHHLIRKLGSDPYIGQRAIFSISQRISILAENLPVMDPVDESFPEMDECMFILIQLIEFLICDYLLSWAENEASETVVFEEWIASVVHARKAVAALEERNGLYLLFMDRITRELAKRVGQVTSFREVEPAILDKIFTFQVMAKTKLV